MFQVLREMLGTSMVLLLRNASNADVWRSFRWYTPPSLPAAQPGVAERDGEGGTVQSYIGQGEWKSLDVEAVGVDF